MGPNLEKRFDRIEQQIKKLNQKQLRTETTKLEDEWAKHEREIFCCDDESITSRSSITSIKAQLAFLDRMASPKRSQPKIITDGRAKTYHEDIHRIAIEKPG
jgi:septal ring factor EnvC (AmiA/AmiB activator)